MGSARRGPRIAIVLVALSAAALGLACKRPAEPARAPRDPLAGVDCGAVRAPADPLLVGWDPTARAELDRLRRQGVVAVRYEAHGCDVELELVPGCVGPKNRYVYVAQSSSASKVMRTAGELLDQAPLGALATARELGPGRALRADVEVVGRVALPDGTRLTEYDFVGPECRRATHFVEALDVGGFALGPVDARAASTNVFTSPPAAGVTREGSAPVCRRAASLGAELPDCSIPVRVALRPLHAPEEAAPASKAPERDAASDEPLVLDEAALERLIRGKQAAVKRACWEVAPSTLRRATIAAGGTIDVEGNVADEHAEVESADGPPAVAAALARCIAREIHGWRFPAPDAPVAFAAPFHFLRQ